jgi:hypothetical protein
MFSGKGLAEIYLRQTPSRQVTVSPLAIVVPAINRTTVS